MRTVYDMRCGCGRRNRLTSLLKEAKCKRCRWPLVYATGRADREMTIAVPMYIRRLPPDARKRRRTTDAKPETP